MGTPVIQTSFNSGEWAPALNARVDLTKYHSGAALLRNFFVDYRGGATTRSGTRYIIQTKSANTVRLIPFQASFTVAYILEFGDGYVRFINNGAPVLETAKVITGITQASPAVVTSAAHGFANGDWVFIASVVGMTQVNNTYFIVAGATTNTFQLTDLNGVAINSSAFTAYASGGTVQRIYIITSPYTATELAAIKFTQNVNQMVICHPNHPPYLLTLVAATNWTLAAINFGTTIGTPGTVAVTTTLSAGTVNYAYVVTAVDANNQESAVSAFGVLANMTDIRSVAGTNSITWAAVTGAVSYNVYKANPRYGAAVAAGSAFGFMANVSGLVAYDTNITPDFSEGPPIVENPFNGTGVQTVTITAAGAYAGLAVPVVSFTGGGGSGAAAFATLTCTSIVSSAGVGAFVGDIITFPAGATGNLVGIVSSVDGSNHINGVTIQSQSGVVAGVVPATSSASGFHGIPLATFTLTWALTSVGITSPGTGYSPAPAVAFSTGAAAATAILGAPSSGNPTVPQFFQQRLVFAGPVSSPQQFNMSQPGNYFNFNVTNPIADDNAISGTLVAGQLNTIQSLISQPQGLITLSDKQAWLINGGSPGAGVGALSIVANAQSYNGANAVPPIVAGDNILYVQAKGSIVRDLVFNFYTQVYTGADISVLSSHLFYGFNVLEWAWAEEPFKLVWAVRNDGTMLTLTFLKEQELIAWAHSDTQGLFKSVATITETVAVGAVDAIYTVVQRMINGNTIQYIERVTELFYPNGAASAINVDCAIPYSGAAALTFSGAQALAGATVTGLATDDLGNTTVITPFAMPTNQTGTFTLPAPTPVGSTGYTSVVIGLAYLPQLQTLQLDLGEPTVQGKRKKIAAVTLRCKDALGLSIGQTFDASSQVPMDDLVLGNLGTMTNAIVTNLVTGDARTIIDPSWDVQGQYCVQQSFPYPASILGVIPEVVVGDGAK